MSKLVCVGMRAVVILAALAGLAGVSRGATLYGVAPFAGGGGSKLYSIDTTTGAATLVAPISVLGSPLSFIGGIEWDESTGTMYAYTSDTTVGKLYTVDPVSGAATEVGFLGTGSTEGGLAFNAAGTLYGIASSPTRQLLTIDKSTGAATAVGPPYSTAFPDVSGIAFSPAGGLFGFDQGFAGTDADELLSFDLLSGAATFIGLTGIDGDLHAGGLDFDPATGILYMTDSESLYTVSVGSGMATLVGAHGLTQMSGIVFIPEPSLGLLLCPALLVICRRGKRPRGRVRK